MNVIHRTTLEYRPSVNEPDFPEPTWKWGPNMSGVVGVPPHYWKAPADWNAVGAGPVEMTAPEKAVVDAEMQAAYLAGVRARYENGTPPGTAYTKLKKVDTSRTANTTLANDPELSFPVEANSDYLFWFRVFFDTTAAADFKCTIEGPASPVGVRFYRFAVAPGATALSGIGVSTAFGGSLAITGNAGTGGYVEGFGVVRNGANAGTVSFQWAQNTSDAGNTIVRAGSILQWGRIKEG